MSQARPFSLGPAAGRGALAGEVDGTEGAATVVLAHGLTATRRYVLHGSRALVRAGHRTVAYDARGHGESDPADGGGYSYDELAGDLAAVVAAVEGTRPVVVCGHSMGAHTIASLALSAPERLAALVLIGPAVTGPVTEAGTLARWDDLADGLERGGVEGFLAAYDQGLDPAWRETLLRIARDRLAAHRHPQAVARALREVPRSAPFDSLAELELVDLPSLIVASRDEADPGHPYAVAEAWAQSLPDSEIATEEPGASPLAWQGGRLSRRIAEFLARPDIAERLREPAGS